MKRIAAVFTGQGSQRVGMGKEFYDTYPESREVFDRASKASDLDLAAICFTENQQLGQTEFTQPAILTTEIAILNALKKHFSFKPDCFAGHSLGEYSALVAAGVIPLEDCVQIVRRRGALMQQAVPLGVGAMAALIQDAIAQTNFADIVQSSGAEVANFNSTAQVVISGPKEAIAKACQNLQTTFPHMTIIQLDVSAPFHCSLMKGIEQPFAEYLNTFKSNFNVALSSTVLSNYFGVFHKPETLIEGLIKQISGSVQWLKNMEVLKASADEFFEIGPARVLSKFLATLEVNAQSIPDFRSLKRTKFN